MKPEDARIRELETLNAVLDAFHRDDQFASGLQTALEKLVELADVSSGWVFTSSARTGDAHAGGFQLAAATGIPPALAADDRADLRLGICECQGMFSRGKLDRGINMVTCSRLAEVEGDRGGLEIHASIPLLAPSGPVGILNLAAPGDRRFDRETLAFLAAIGKAIGTAFERFRLQEDRLQEARFSAALEERQRLARDMHDALSQLLFAAELSVGTARQGDRGASAGASLDDAATILAEAQAELRALVEVLRVPDVSCGLDTALQRLARRTSSHVRVHVDVQGAALVDERADVAEALYRIAQEALHNALRHAAADQVWIRLRATSERVALTVRDDGIGLPDTLSGGVGIPGMRDRAEALGGRLTLESGERGGTTVRAEVPPTDAPLRGSAGRKDNA